MQNSPWWNTGEPEIHYLNIESFPPTLTLFFSPEIHDLTTLSLHHFEDDEMLGGYVHNEWVPSVRVDPENR